MKSKKVVVQGIETHYKIFDEYEGQPLIFLHGWSMDVSGDTFLAVAKPLVEKIKCPIILIDLPGMGRSSSPPKSGWDTYDYELWFEEFLKALKIKKANFYGHSFGCRILVRFLVKNKDFSGKVIFTSAAGIRWPYSFRQKISIWFSKRFVITKKVMSLKLQKFIMTKIFGARDWGTVRDNMRMSLRKILAGPDFRKELPKIKNQVLHIWGKKDGITPLKSGKIYEQKLPHAKLKIIDDGQHGIHKTHSKEIVALVETFLC